MANAEKSAFLYQRANLNLKARHTAEHTNHRSTVISQENTSRVCPCCHCMDFEQAGASRPHCPNKCRNLRSRSGIGRLLPRSEISGAIIYVICYLPFGMKCFPNGKNTGLRINYYVQLTNQGKLFSDTDHFIMTIIVNIFPHENSEQGLYPNICIITVYLMYCASRFRGHTTIKFFSLTYIRCNHLKGKIFGV